MTMEKTNCDGSWQMKVPTEFLFAILIVIIWIVFEAALTFLHGLLNGFALGGGWTNGKFIFGFLLMITVVSSIVTLCSLPPSSSGCQRTINGFCFSICC